MTARGVKLPKGECQVCGDEWSVVGDGEDVAMRRHRAKKLEHMDRKGKCLGSGNPPAVITQNGSAAVH